MSKNQNVLLLLTRNYHLAHRQYVSSEKAPYRLWYYEKLPRRAPKNAETKKEEFIITNYMNIYLCNKQIINF